MLAFLSFDKALSPRSPRSAARVSGAESVVFAVQGIVLAALALVESGRGGEVSGGDHRGGGRGLG